MSAARCASPPWRWRSSSPQAGRLAPSHPSSNRRSNHMSVDLHQLTAGLPPGTEIAERAKPIEGDRDLIFKQALDTSHETPHGLSKVIGTERETFDPKTVTSRAEGEGL